MCALAACIPDPRAGERSRADLGRTRPSAAAWGTRPVSDGERQPAALCFHRERLHFGNEPAASGQSYCHGARRAPGAREAESQHKRHVPHQCLRRESYSGGQAGGAGRLRVFLLRARERMLTGELAPRAAAAPAPHSGSAAGARLRGTPESGVGLPSGTAASPAPGVAQSHGVLTDDGRAQTASGSPGALSARLLREAGRPPAGRAGRGGGGPRSCL